MRERTSILLGKVSTDIMLISRSRWWCLGKVRSGRGERSKDGASDWTRCPSALSSQVWKVVPEANRHGRPTRPTICSV